jgi:hypothetical protein
MEGKMEKKEKKYSYFQFNKDENFPVFIRCEVAAFDSKLISQLVDCQFTELTAEESEKALELIDSDPHSKVLHILPATPKVAIQIDLPLETDRYGKESFTDKKGYSVYRYQGLGLLVYSFRAKEWELGVLGSFASEEAELATRVIINRYLGWATAPLGLIGLWGNQVDEGVLILNREESIGEAVFLDIVGRNVFGRDGKSVLGGDFKILRPTRAKLKRRSPMRAEELISFLLNRTTYFDYKGPSVPVRQLLQAISKNIKAYVISEDELEDSQEGMNSPSDLSL